MKHPQQQQQQLQQQKNYISQKQHRQQEDSSSLSLKNEGINEEQLEQALKTLSKIKKIHKDKLTKYKKKSRSLNSLFGSMSQFFLYNIKKKQYLKQKKIAKQQRILKKTQNLKLKARKFEQKIYQSLVKQLKNSNQNNNQNSINYQNSNNSPIIINQQQLSSSSNSSSVNLPYKNDPICYICRLKYKQLDQLYPKHCPPCAVFSKKKRYQKADLTGLIALVTGGRIKIGYQIVLKLLRDGAMVYTTTRFSHDALIRYEKQKDFSVWKNRLFIIQCDFMSVSQIKHLLQTIKSNVSHLDILINNAAQTLYRPKQFFTLELQKQQMALTSSNSKIVLDLPRQLQQRGLIFPSIQHQCDPFLQLQQQKQGFASPDNSNIIVNQIDLNNLDEFGQPTDLRTSNTWTQSIQDTSLVQCLTTQTINSTIPFLLIGQLKSIMGNNTQSNNSNNARSYIINVSSMQGIFYRNYKSHTHPHTNMAKAALNMITRTCYMQFSRSNIFMNSVDTGWVTNQNPHTISVRMQDRYKFQVPLDCIEGAMRVLDPIYLAVRDHYYVAGKFYKDYQQSLW